MASKKFGDLSGVRIKLREGGSESNECRRARQYEIDKYDVTYCGDVVFEIDFENKTINRCNVKYIYKDYHGEMLFYYCDIRYNRDFKPTYETFYGFNIPANMKLKRAMYNKSVCGLVCTSMEEAIKRLGKLNEGKYFGVLKEGDKIYMVDKVKEVVREETVRELYSNHETNRFSILTENYNFRCDNSEYEENTSAFSDKSFYVNGERYLDEKKYSIHMDKTVAEKTLREYLNSRENAKKKKDEKPKIEIGTPIRHTDNKNKELHYGDLVAYVRKDWGGHTDISFGVIIGDSEKKIKILDKTEDGKKTNDWRNKRRDEIHMLEPPNILLIKLAK